MILDEWKSAQRQRVIRYAHFDRRISLEQCWKYISSPESVAIHAFMPFIHYTITTRKVKNGKKQPPKKREIFYAAHKDAWIYRYYSYLLNEQYNARVQQDGIDSVAVAYRNNFKGRNNIDFANDAFRFIQSCRSCCVMIGDFTSFFDNISHPYLKKELCDLLNVECLPPDYYAIFKSVTRFSYAEMNDLLDYIISWKRIKTDKSNSIRETNFWTQKLYVHGKRYLRKIPICQKQKASRKVHPLVLSLLMYIC